jgi:oligopeptide/dipeptide ABC transporter ATP-binding protein
VERVVKEPRHPYTQLLISAIPRAHAARDWLGQADDSRRSGDDLDGAGCCFAERCPHALPACLASPPGLYRTEPRRAVACVLYGSHPALPAGNPGLVLSGAG